MEVAFRRPTGRYAIRAGWFMENLCGTARGCARNGRAASMLAPLDRAIPMVATADIGASVAAVLQSEWTGQRSIDLEGPARYSPNEVAAACARCVGGGMSKPSAAAVAVASGLPVVGASPPRSAAALGEMLEAFNSGWISYERDWGNTEHGSTPLTTVLAATDLKGPQ